MKATTALSAAMQLQMSPPKSQCNRVFLFNPFLESRPHLCPGLPGCHALPESLDNQSVPNFVRQA